MAQAKQKTVTFNVGGEKFEVSTDLFDLYPDTMLAKSVSKHWRDPDSQDEIFLDRCPILFRHVLEYLRDKKTHLPMTVAKAGVLSELKYYCVDGVDESTIDASPLLGPELGRSVQQGLVLMNDAVKELDKSEKKLKESERSILLAKLCIEFFTAYAKHKPGTSVMSCPEGYVDKDIQNSNEHLNKVGLKARRTSVDFINVSSM